MLEESIDEQRAVFEQKQLEQRELEARKLELQLETREVQTNLKAARDAIARKGRAFDVLKRKLKGQQKIPLSLASLTEVLMVRLVLMKVD